MRQGLWPTDLELMDAITASAISTAKTSSQISTAVAVKASDIDKQQGEAAVALIADAAKIGRGEARDGRADVYA